LTLPREKREEEAMRVHELKTWPGPFRALLDGFKTFELRRDDRAYAVGDVLLLKEYDPAILYNIGHVLDPSNYTGREIRKLVTYRCSLAEWIDDAPRGWVVLGIVDEPAGGLCKKHFFVDNSSLGRVCMLGREHGGPCRVNE
jgi:hypothetical protein